MKNLVLLQEKRHKVAHVVDICHIDDGVEESAVILTNDGTIVGPQWEKRLGAPSDLSSSSDKWFNATFLDPNIVCLSKNGSIISIIPETGQEELVGEFEFGILAAEWSPDKQVLALLTLATLTEASDEQGNKNGVLLTMSTDFDVLCEVVLEPFDTNASVNLAWRPDGTLLAVNTFEVADNVRRIRTYTRDSLQLHSVGRSEDGSGKAVPNLEPPLAWASTGCSNLIASVQLKTKKTQQVVFFEPNGLRHREFGLRYQPQDATVKLLCWNSSSDLLAVVLERQGGEPPSTMLQLWHRSNYHWYLKYEWRYADRIHCVRFHDEHAYRLFVGLEDEWREYVCCWDVSSYSITDYAFTAFVIDGERLHLTPFHKAIIPPPMYAVALELEHCIRSVAFQGETGIVHLSNGSLLVIQGSFNQEVGANKSDIIANYNAPVVLGPIEWELPGAADYQSLRHVVITKVSESAIDVIAADYNNHLIEINIDTSTKRAIILRSMPLDNPVLRIVSWSDSVEGALIELDDGELLEYFDGDVMPSCAEPLLEPCPWIAGLFHASKLADTDPSHTHRERLIFGRSPRSRLYCHDRLLADSASSFLLTTAHKFLCYTTAAAYCQLRSLPLSSLYNFDPLMGSEDQNLEGYEPRNIERGAKLVAVLPDQPTGVLQMPRGNLEGIYPRSLVLPFVMSRIESEEYGSVFTTMRRQKVDLNLIVDLNPEKFLYKEGIVKFVEEVTQIDYLNLFISTLQNFDVTQFRYTVPLWFKRRSNDDDETLTFDFGTKVNQVCQKLRQLLKDAEERGSTMGGKAIKDGHYLLPILSTYAKESPPKLEEALTMIGENASARNHARSRKSSFLSDKAQGSIQYLAFLADYELLFNTALGMYDFELARGVARNSQMDPKIYLPLLKRLSALPEFFAKYEVDVQLKRHEPALSNLYQSSVQREILDAFEPSGEEGVIFGNSFDHCLALIERHKLHRLGLKLYNYDATKRGLIMKSLGQNLLEEGNAKVALSIFLSMDQPYYEGARRAARTCGDWRCFLSLMEGSESDDPETRKLRTNQIAHDIAEEIAEGRKGSSSKKDALLDASRILLDYGLDVVSAVDMLISAEMWSEGRRIALLYSRNDLAKRVVDSAAAYAKTLMVDFIERKQTFEETLNRYVDVLRIRRDAIQKSGFEDDEMMHPEDDSGSLFSVTSTSSIRSTASSGSAASIGSVASVSSVISVGKESSFTMTSELDLEKHKSKFNSIGKKKEKKKRKRQRRKTKPGSEEELRSLVTLLRVTCVDEEYSGTISDTALFLSQVGHFDLSQEIYESFERLRASIESLQCRRIEEAATERREAIREARIEGLDNSPITLKCEAEVDALRCQKLAESLSDLLSFFVSS